MRGRSGRDEAIGKCEGREGGRAGGGKGESDSTPLVGAIKARHSACVVVMAEEG